ncbi:hypothetical protein L917_15421 [Phytophthora nicotianae]|uniref:Uncharacterized protein n=1 Tax=Phytophthora nicotianae TaxID=4792 RepID=W2KKK4_PHYNI|nr:hypothetical protein L915_15709 [Phytophthora nicotianae]ETK78218.1 hypothetical protein L915_15707 [Phytophthora nicotianae]ETL84880.1 hypothetical protein L917_15421 [Phytophthora nicotianae]
MDDMQVGGSFDAVFELVVTVPILSYEPHTGGSDKRQQLFNFAVVAVVLTSVEVGAFSVAVKAVDTLELCVQYQRLT